jgi:hypothetical protein
MQETRRLALHAKLCELLGSKKVYFQPPESVRMKYPAIRYNLTSGDTRYADNGAYNHQRRYEVTVIEKNPDIPWDEKMLNAFQYCSFERMYAAENLNHWQFSLYY